MSSEKRTVLEHFVGPFSAASIGLAAVACTPAKSTKATDEGQTKSVASASDVQLRDPAVTDYAKATVSSQRASVYSRVEREGLPSSWTKSSDLEGLKEGDAIRLTGAVYFGNSKSENAGEAFYEAYNASKSNPDKNDLFLVSHKDVKVQGAEEGSSDFDGRAAIIRNYATMAKYAERILPGDARTSFNDFANGWDISPENSQRASFNDFANGWD
jgi:hypothetical protein